MLFGRIIFENDHWIVAVGLLGGMKVTMKDRGLTRRVRADFRTYFFDVVETLKNHGVPIEPGNPTIEELAEEFAEAVFGGSVRQQVFFNTYPPDEKAKHYLEPHEADL